MPNSARTIVVGCWRRSRRWRTSLVGEHVATVCAHCGLADRRAEAALDLDQVGEQVAFEVGADACPERRVRGPHRVVRDPIGPHGADAFDAGAEHPIERCVDVAVRWSGQRGAAVDEDEVSDEFGSPFGDHLDHEGTHRVAHQHEGSAELFDDRCDVVGVAFDSVRLRCVEAPPAPSQVDGHEIGGAGEVVRQWVPDPGVRRDAVHCHDAGSSQDSGPRQRSQLGAVDLEAQELSSSGQRPSAQHSPWCRSTLRRCSCANCTARTGGASDPGAPLSEVRVAGRGLARRGCCA